MLEYVSNTSLQFAVFDSTGTLKFANKATTALNTWTHLVGTCTATEVRLYINGTLQATAAIASFAAGTAPLSIGGRASGSNLWTGRLDEPRIWQFGAAGDPGAAFWTARYNAGAGLRP